MQVRFEAGVTRRGGRALTGANHITISTLKIDRTLISSAVTRQISRSSVLVCSFICFSIHGWLERRLK